MAEAAPADIGSIIFAHLTHNCYGETARAFLAQWKSNEAELETHQRFALDSLECRKELARLITEGRIQEALRYGEQFFPQVFCDEENASNRRLRFRLMTQHFVELVRLGSTCEALDYTESVLTDLAQRDPENLAHLQEAVVLLAYADPADSPVRHLLSVTCREELAVCANAAVLGRPQSVLEDTLKQLLVVSASADAPLADFKRENPHSSVDYERVIKDLISKDGDQAV